MDAKTAKEISNRIRGETRKEILKREEEREEKVISEYDISYILEKILKEVRKVAEEGNSTTYYLLFKLERSWDEKLEKEKIILGKYLAKLLKHKGFEAKCIEDSVPGRVPDAEIKHLNSIRIYIKITW